jgi:hypothetical protein
VRGFIDMQLKNAENLTVLRIFLTELCYFFYQFYCFPKIAVTDFIIQGGSDISGTLSKLHRSIIKSYFSLILSRQTVSPVCRIINKTNRHILAKINQQEATRAETVFGLRAGRTSKEITSYGDFSKNTFLR